MGLAPSAFSHELRDFRDRDTTPQVARMPESFTATWLASGGLERPRLATDALHDPALPPECPRYRTLRALGRGGCGSVWLVHDAVLDREVALKVLSAELGESPDLRARFLYEARITGGLTHTGIIPVYDAGMLPDGRCYYTMQFIHGPTLADAIEARTSRRYGALGLRTLVALVARVCRTMAYVHGQGICHRDLKPANILIGPDGEPWIADWGLAGPSESGSPPPPARPGQQVLSGTLHYMAPEQLSGDGRHLGPVTDVYSLGATLFEVLTGRTPHHGATALGLMFQIRNVDAPDPRLVAPEANLAPELAAVCNAALIREPGRRHLTATTIADRLERILHA